LFKYTYINRMFGNIRNLSICVSPF